MALVLSRKPDERILLERNGEVIDILVCQIVGNKVRLGVTADQSWNIRRAELTPDEGKARRRNAVPLSADDDAA